MEAAVMMVYILGGWGSFWLRVALPTLFVPFRHPYSILIVNRHAIQGEAVSASVQSESVYAITRHSPTLQHDK
jgi:hypothetical protein